MTKTEILLIYTGGTIGMMKDPETGLLKPFDFGQISSQVPEIKQFGFHVESIQFSPLIDSSNVDSEFWKKLVDIIKENYEKYEGFVILHGTDTMSFTASALSFMLEGLFKPVILTGSQLPIGTLRTDGKENLVTAIEIAAAKENNRPIVPEVCIYFENKLYRGNRTTKHNAEHFDAFQSNNYPILAEAGIHIHYNYKAIYYSEHKRVLKTYTNLDNNIALLKIFPNINKTVVESVLQTKGLKGVVMETFGSGNAPTNKWFIDALRDAVNRGIVIINITQCARGSVEMGRYETSSELVNIGIISGFDITTEAAITKLMFLLGQNLTHNEVAMYMGISLAGELTVQ